MSINEIAGAIGDWTLKLRDDTPKEILDQLDYFGHVALVSGKVNPVRYGDNLLATARYVGVLRSKKLSAADKSIGGGGMAMWLGDEDDKGDVIESPITFTSSTFNSAISTLLPTALFAGTVYAQAGTYTAVHQYESRRKSLDYITSLYGCEWRVNYDGTVDVGTVAQLYSPTPTCAIVARHPEGGVDMDRRILAGESSLDADMEDFTTRAFLISEPEDGSPPVTGSANINPLLNPYKDIHGSAVKMTRLISGSNTTAGNAPAVAQLQLNRFTSPREAVELNTITHDIKGDLFCGGYIWVDDPESKLQDLGNQIRFKNLVLNPVKLRVMELTYPVEKGNTVAYRHWDGTWYDLTPYVVWERGQTTVVVGGYNRSLTGVGGSLTPVGSLPLVNLTIPAAPTWNAPFTLGTYISLATGLSRAQIVLEWSQPLNTNGDVIVDGSRYEIRYRGTQNDPAMFQNAWNMISIPWGIQTFLLLELDPGTTYEFQIRAVDSGAPENVSAWSALNTTTTQMDTVPPSAPAPGTIAAGKLSVQLSSTLGKATGGTYNLEADLHHLNLYRGTSSGFAISDAGLVGSAPCNLGHLIAGNPIIASFNIETVTADWYKITAVDNDGNESLASTAVQQTATLLDSASISSLVVSKVAAGTISTNWIQAAEMATALTGARMAIAYYGMEGFNTIGTKVFDFNTSDGSLYLEGSFQVNDGGDRIWMSSVTGYPTIQFFDSATGTDYAYINAVPIGSSPTRIGLGMNSGPDGISGQSTLFLHPDSFSLQYNTTPSSPPANRRRGGYVDGTVGQASIGATNDISNGVTQARFTAFDTGHAEMVANSTSGTQMARVKAHSSGQIEINLAGAERVTVNGGSGIVQAAGGFISGGAAEMFELGGSRIYMDYNSGNLHFVQAGGGIVKTFVIDHPDDDERHLVHATTESPHAGTEYWGMAVVIDGKATVDLPSYFESLNQEERRVVLLQVVADPETLGKPVSHMASYPTFGQFQIYAVNCPKAFRMFWTVKAVRKDVPQFAVEPLKTRGKLRGDGPYTYFVES